MGKGKGRFVLFVIAGFVFLGVGSAGAIVWGLGRVSDEIRNAPGFAAGWDRATANPALVEAVGAPSLAPFNLVDFVAGRQPWLFNASFVETLTPSDNAARPRLQERDEIEVPILGPRGAGSLKIEAVQLNGGAWELKKLEARVNGRPQPLDLLGRAPPTAAQDERPKAK